MRNMFISLIFGIICCVITGCRGDIEKSNTSIQQYKENSNDSLQFHNKFHWILFDTSLAVPVEYMLYDSIALILNNVEQVNDSIISSEFVIIIERDTLYDFGLILVGRNKLGYLVNCPEGIKRYFLSDTTFQIPMEGLYCLKHLVESEWGQGVNFQSLKKRNIGVDLTLFAKSNSRNINFIHMIFEKDFILNKMELDYVR